MGRKGSWFSALKNTISPKSKEKKAQKADKSKTKHPDTNSYLAVETPVLPPVPLPEEIHLNETEIEPSTRGYYDAPSTSVAAEADVASSEIVVEVIHVAPASRFAGKSKEEVAAIKIQTVFRGYLARRALRALRGLVRLKQLMQGHGVKLQSATALRCMQTLAHVQSQIHSRRIRMSEENQALQRHLLQKRAKELEKMGEDWDDSLQSKEQVEASLLSKHEAAIRRERALAYAFSHQQSWKNPSKCSNPLFMDLNCPQWGWSWLERWMAAGESRSIAEKDGNSERASVKNASRGGEISKSYARHQLNSSLQSPLTPVSKADSYLSVAGKLKLSADDDTKSMLSMQSERNRRHSIGGLSVRDDESLASSPSVPSYMAPTKSARAKSSSPKPPSPSGLEKNGTPEKSFVGSTKKRLSFPSSPARPRRHSGPPKVDTSIIKEQSVSIEGAS